MLVKSPNFYPRQLVVIIRADFFILLVGSNIYCECSIIKGLGQGISKSLQIYIKIRLE